MEQTKKIITCGIDASLTKTGISYFENGIYKNHTLISTQKCKNSDEKFKCMCEGIIEVLAIWKPDIIAIERMHTVRQIDVFRKFCKIAGIVQWYCWSNDVFYIELSPTDWRAGVKDKDEKLPRKREELKQWSKNKVNELYNIEVSDDESDAILIAIGYINKFKDKKEKRI